jgi:hypothetical protein
VRLHPHSRAGEEANSSLAGGCQVSITSEGLSGKEVKVNKDFSPGEERLLELLLEEEGKVNTNYLARIFYEGREKPFNARQTVVGLIRTLCEKTRENSIRVRKTKRGGPHPIQVWIERREEDDQ